MELGADGPQLRVTADAGAMAALRVKYLEELIVASHQPHDQRWTVNCATCNAKRKLADVARQLGAKP